MDDAFVGKFLEGIAGHHIALTTEMPVMKEKDTFLWTYYDRSREVDFVYRGDKGFLAIEVKYQTEVKERDVFHMDAVKNYLILSKTTLNLEDVMIVPLSTFLVLLDKSKEHL